MRWSQPVCPSQAGTAECTLKIGSVLTVVSQSAKNAQGKLTEAIETLRVFLIMKKWREYLGLNFLKNVYSKGNSFLSLHLCFLGLVYYRSRDWIFLYGRQSRK
jgi:hypothetical protein